ncbi:MAG: hypothetical protein AVDCRST_MAG41-572, partial [uncultured Corynebacteriales bacterium]
RSAAAGRARGAGPLDRRAGAARAHPAGDGGRQARRRRPVEPGGRRGAAPVGPYGRLPPGARLPQARRAHPPPARRGPARHRHAGAPGADARGRPV